MIAIALAAGISLGACTSTPSVDIDYERWRSSLPADDRERILRIGLVGDESRYRIRPDDIDERDKTIVDFANFVNGLLPSQIEAYLAYRSSRGRVNIAAIADEIHRAPTCRGVFAVSRHCADGKNNIQISPGTCLRCVGGIGKGIE